MRNQISPRQVVSLLTLISLLALPAVLESQCMVTTTVSFPTTPTRVVYKILSAMYVCGTTMMNAINCTPTAPFNTTFLGATANSTLTANPSCAWSCTCGTGLPPHVTIDGMDGLPIELMDWDIESSERDAEDDTPLSHDS